MTVSNPAWRVVAVIPTYNEAATIVDTIEQLVSQPCHPDVIVVDDSSPDGTGQRVRESSPYLDGRVRLLYGARKSGIGRAYRQGFAAAVSLGYDVVVQLDADGSHRCSDLEALLDALSDADLAIGSRYVSGGSARGLPLSRRCVSRAGNQYARAWLRLGVHDLTGGFKAWRREALVAIDPRASRSEGYTFQMETTLRAHRQGARIREVPIEFGRRRGGESKMNWAIAIEAIVLVPKLATGRARADRANVARSEIATGSPDRPDPYYNR